MNLGQQHKKPTAHFDKLFANKEKNQCFNTIQMHLPFKGVNDLKKKHMSY